MAWSLISSAKGKATTASMDTTGADFLVVFIATDGSFTVSDSKGNTNWNYATVGTYGRIAYCVPTSVGTGHTFSTPVSYSYVFAAAFSGSNATPYDTESSGGGTNPSVSSGVPFSGEPGSITPAEADELFITGIALGYDAGSASIDDSFTVAQSQTGSPGVAFGGALAYKIKTDGTAENPTWSASATSINSQHTLRMAAFKAAGGSTNYSETVANGSLTLTGQSVGFGVSSVATNGSLTFAGQDVTFTHAVPGAYSITLEHGTLSFSSPESYSAISALIEAGTLLFSGQDITGTQGLPMSYSVTLDPGTLTFTGRNVNLVWSGAPITNVAGTGLSISMRMGL